MKIRRLNTKDFWNVLGILRKGGKEAFTKMREIEAAEAIELKDASPEEKEAAKKAANTQRGMILFDIGMEYAEEELSRLFADLAGFKNVEEYHAAGFDTTLEIIEQLTENEDLGNFFARVAALTKKFSAGNKRTA
jgi:hypothetical protein